MEKNMKRIDNKSSFLTIGSNGGVTDEYYIDEIIGIAELPYSEWLRTDKHQLELFPKDVEDKCES
tara:strand:- start:2132 stop:2326 length:195 start_codon:yes stop_codon:yes gene_type:complete